MFQIRTVLCPVDFSDLDHRVLDLALEVCRAFGSRLILHHNVGHAPTGPAVSWMYHQEHRDGHHTEDSASNKLREMLAALPKDVRAEARLSNGITAASLRHLEEDLHADLVILASHGPSTPDHASVAEQIIEQSACPVLALHQDRASTLHIHPLDDQVFDVLVPTDFSAAGERAVSYACELARILPFRLHLLHVIPARRSAWIETGASMTPPIVHEGEASQQVRARLAALIPQELENRISVRVKIGDPAEKIAETAANLGVSCIIMGAHARTFLRRFFTRDTSKALLHAADCPVWFVPEIEAA